ncbi:multidrug efflux MFS transporter [Cellulosimicrobium funkei]|nr:multidrug efflux MFS transporter [Cellulosimicrobium funkei]
MTDVIHKEANPPTGNVPAVAGGPAAAPNIKVAPIIATLVVTAFVMILNETVLSVALPTLIVELGITAVTAQWLSTGFMLTMAIVIPTTGFLLNRFSTRTVFITALSSFLVGTALCAVAPTFEILMAGRVVQAIGTAMVLPLLMTTTLALVPFQHRGTVMGLSSVVISVAPALGPTISGIVLQNMGWNALFILMLPIVLVALVIGLVFIKNYNEPKPLTLDGLSVLIAALGFGGFVYGVANLSAVIDGSAVVVPAAAFIIGLLALTAFVLRQTRLERTQGQPLLNLRAFTVPTFRTSLIVVLVAMFSMLGTVVVLPIYMTSSLGVETITVGLALLPGGLAQGVLSPVIGNLYDRIGPKPLVVPGALLMSLGFWLQFAFLDENSTVGMVIGFNVVFNIGMAMVMTPLMTHSLGSLPRTLYADGSAILNTLQQLAAAIGTALFVALLTLGMSSAVSSGATERAAAASGLGWPFLVGGVLTLAAAALALTIRRLTAAPEEPAATA